MGKLRIIITMEPEVKEPKVEAKRDWATIYKRRLDYHKRYYRRNKDKIKKGVLLWRVKHPEKVKKIQARAHERYKALKELEKKNGIQ